MRKILFLLMLLVIVPCCASKLIPIYIENEGPGFVARDGLFIGFRSPEEGKSAGLRYVMESGAKKKIMVSREILPPVIQLYSVELIPSGENEPLFKLAHPIRTDQCGAFSVKIRFPSSRRWHVVMFPTSEPEGQKKLEIGISRADPRGREIDYGSRDVDPLG